MMVLCSYGHVLRPWYGQVCFPGGMVEENTDHNIIDTSLREMEEEIGMHHTGSPYMSFFTKLNKKK
jgi:8-oxo-dGTP pyrophosphatase MutT (NUDIX family)